MATDTETFTYPFQLTDKLHRSLYPLLDPAQPENSAKGKNVVITGASQGIGVHISEAWCIAKASGIVITARREKELEEVAAKLRSQFSSTKIIAQTSDIKSEESVKALYERAKDELGTIHVVVNNAAAITSGSVGGTEPSKWWHDYEVNVKGFYLMNYYFIKQGGGKGTTIAFNTGGAGIVVPGMGSYNTSKLAQAKATEFLQLENPELRAYSILPGIVMTPMTLDMFKPYAHDDPKLSGGLSVFLSTPRADWLKGGTVSVNWDIEEMEVHKEEIESGNLLKLGYLGAKLQKGGHPWKS